MSLTEDSPPTTSARLMDVMRPRFRCLSHTADVRLLVWGDDERELFTNALVGSQSLAFGRSRHGRATLWMQLRGMPNQPPMRLARVVNEGLFALYTRRLVVVDLRLDQHNVLLGLRPIRKGEILEVEIKAATLHDLTVKSMNGRWHAVLTLDL